jgi:tRNA-binding protein
MDHDRVDEGGRDDGPELLHRKPDVSPEGFFALDLRVGRVASVRRSPGARKPAWVLEVDFGPAVGVLRTSAQVTKYTEDELLDRLVVGVINIGRRRVASIESEFLVLGALDPDGTVHLLEVPPAAPVGSAVA